MALFFLLLLFITFPFLSFSAEIFTDTIYPNFSASYFSHIDSSGSFLYSQNRTFKASFVNFKTETSRYYFAVVHVASNTIIWTANRDNPISNSDRLTLTGDGLMIVHNSNQNSTVWSARLSNSGSGVSSLQLQDSGNLVLLDRSNVSLWESFDYATDTIVLGQNLSAGRFLVGSHADDDLRSGDYRLVVTGTDAVLEWNGLAYWKMSMDTSAFQDSSVQVAFLAMMDTGLFLFGKDGSTVVLKVTWSYSTFRLAKLDPNGRLSVRSLVDGLWVQEFTSPAQDCQIPSVCGENGLCKAGVCSCPSNFHGNSAVNGSCTPNDSSLSLPSACKGNVTEFNSSISYVALGHGVDYFSNNFVSPVRRSVSLSVCQDLCSKNCSCLGIFHGDTSGSCYLIENYLGSFMSVSANTNDRLGYVKTIVGLNTDEDDKKRKFPIAGLVLLPAFAFLVVVILCGLVFIWWRRGGLSKHTLIKFIRNDSSSSDLEIISIPGLPVNFSYEELAVATDNFKTPIGSGGFGTVYKGTLPDNTIVAVKKINNLGVQGKKEFCTEIAIIGNIHHVNLVKLKGFCAHKRQCLLVYEYMNRGSLDRALFGNDRALGWQERYSIALGTARGLAYLHSGCARKIIHCDVKPENILLHENLQVKISDFGLSKLLTPEQSCLFTTLRGTRGYLAPEWLAGSTISDKADVYSYGMVLLEILRGRKNSSPQTIENISSRENKGHCSNSPASSNESRLVYFPLLALEMHERSRYLELADSRLEGHVTSCEIEKLVRLALCCLHEEPMLRPTMANVVSILESDSAPMLEPRLDLLNFLRLYGRSFGAKSTDEGLGNEDEEFVLLGNENCIVGSCNSVSYMSSQQVSGPR